ncbi:MAG: TolC family protein [Elusimicrobia bacterium]|nr:TolC family protein [Elusimicrobiota bacterium]
MKVYVAFLAVLAATGPALAQSPAPAGAGVGGSEIVELNFEDLSRLIQGKNENIRGANLLAESAQARRGHLPRSYWPQIKAEGGSERFQTGRYATATQPYGSAEARINIYQGGKDALEEKGRESQSRIAGAEAKKVFSAELLEARKLYWMIVCVREMVRILESALEQNERNLKAAQRRIQSGLAAETDRLEFEIHRTQLKEEIASLNHEAQLIQISLAPLLGLDITTRFTTPENIPHGHDDDLLAASIEVKENPLVETLSAKSVLIETQSLQAQRWWMPSLDLYGAYQLYTLRDRDYLTQTLRDDRVVGVNLRMFLFDGFRSRADARSFSLAQKGFELQRAQAALTIEAQVKRAKEEMRHLHELIHNGENLIEQSSKYLAGILDEYRRGVKNSLDVLGASQKYLGFQRQYAQRRRDYQVARSLLFSLIGQ